MYAFTDKQKAELFDAGVTLDDVANFHDTDDNAWLSANLAFEGVLRWYGDDTAFDYNDITF